jgi:DNA-directed RNA polymerase specialized sigma24 family protein
MRMSDVDDTAVRPARATLSGADLRRRLRLGDERALAELYDVHAALVHGLALRVTGDPAAAEDVTEEVFVTAWEHPERFDPATSSVAGWLAAMAHRAAVERLRRDGVPAPSEPPVPLAWPPVAIDLEPTAAADGPDRPRAGGPVRTALAALPSEDRSALLLAYFGGRTYREVGDVLGIAPDLARTRIGAALHQLAAALTAEGNLP